MRKILLLLLLLVLLCSLGWGQNIITLSSPPPAPVVSGNATVIGSLGNATYSYFIVAKYAVGNVSTVTPVTTIRNAPATPSVSNSIRVNWTPPANLTVAITYDVVRLTGIVNFPSSGTCSNCLVSASVAATTLIDQLPFSILTSYTLGSSPSTSTATELIDNGSYVLPRLIFSANSNTDMVVNAPLNLRLDLSNVTFPATLGGITQLTGDVTAGPGTGVQAAQVKNLSNVSNASLANAGLVNSATTVNGQTCTLGGGCTVTGAPSGTAGGDLNGSYPNPGVAQVNGAVVPTSATVVGTNASKQIVSATVQGNGSKVQLSTGTTTSNDCVKFDANGNTVDAGAACGTGGTGLTASVPYLTDGTHFYIGPILRQVTLPIQGNFSWVNQSTASEVTDGGALYITDASHGASDSVSMREQAIGSNTVLTVSFSCLSGFNGTGGQIIAKCGIGFRESATGKLVLLSIGDNGSNQRAYEILQFTNPTTLSTGPINDGNNYQNTGMTAQWWQLRYDGANIQFYICGNFPPSTTGSAPATANCQQYYSQAKAAFFTTAPDQWGYYVDAKSAAARTELYSWLAVP